MTGPALVSAAVLRDRRDELEFGLGAEAGRWLRELAGEDGYAVWLDGDDLAIYVADPPADFADRLGSDPSAAALRVLLDACTSFDPALPGKSVLLDVHHVTDGMGPALP